MPRITSPRPFTRRPYHPSTDRLAMRTEVFPFVSTFRAHPSKRFLKHPSASCFAYSSRTQRVGSLTPRKSRSKSPSSVLFHGLMRPQLPLTYFCRHVRLPTSSQPGVLSFNVSGQSIQKPFSPQNHTYSSAHAVAWRKLSSKWVIRLPRTGSRYHGEFVSQA